MITCYDCGKPITTKMIWKRWYDGKNECYCDKCARSHMGGCGDFGLMLATKEEVENE